jgi:hypothetical protein
MLILFAVVVRWPGADDTVTHAHVYPRTYIELVSTSCQIE